MKKTTILILFLLFLCNLVSAQDIVYDSTRGNQNYWRREKAGKDEKVTGLWYENLGIIVRSKVLLAARVWDGLQENVDFRIDSLLNDTIVFEYKTTPPLNLIFYQYYVNDTISYNFIGLRKAAVGSDLFTGQYLYICPIINGSQIKIFEGIGANRSLLLSINADDYNINYTDYNVSEQITFQIIKGTQTILRPKILDFTTSIDENLADKIKMYPNPTSDLLSIEIPGNSGVMIRIFNNKPTLIYQEYLSEESKMIDVSTFPIGIYVLVISDEKSGSIITSKKIIKN